MTLALCARLLLAGVFLIASLAKLSDRAAARRAVIGFGLPAVLAGPIALLVPTMELAVAGALLPATSAWWAALGAAGLLALFTSAIAVNLALGRAPDCQCFGRLHRASSGRPAIARNAALLGVALLVVAQGAGRTGPGVVAGVGELGAFGASALGLLAIIGVWSLARLLGRGGARRSATTARSKSGLVPGASAPGFSALDLEQRPVTLDVLLASGRPAMLVFTDPDCGPCTALLPEIAEWQRNHTDALAVFEITRGSIERARALRKGHDPIRVLVQADREIADAYGAVGTPSAVTVRRDGRIGSRIAGGRAEIIELLDRELGLEPGSRTDDKPPPTLPALRKDISALPFSRRQGVQAALALFAVGSLVRPGRASAACSQCPTFAPQCCKDDPIRGPVCCTPDEVCCPELDGCCPPNTRCGVRGPAPCIRLCPGGADPCGASGLCCAEDQICEPQRGICCPHDEDAPECIAAEKACAEEVEERYKFYVETSCAGPGRAESLAIDLIEVRGGREAGNADAYYALGCHIAAYAIWRRRWLDDCPQRPDDSRCGPGGRCDPGTGKCNQPDCGERQATSRVAASRTGAAAYASLAGPIANRSPVAVEADRDPAVTAIRRALRDSHRALQRDADRLSKAFHTPAAGSSIASGELLAALAVYRRDVMALRASVARVRTRSARGRRARALVLKSLDAAAAGLKSSRRAAAAPTSATARTHAQRARKTFAAGSRSAGRARRALGCARGC